MTKVPFLFALSLAVACLAGGCTVYTTTRPVYVERGPAWQPAYVYTYGHGCWADDVWYSPCPVAPGPSYGYYVYADGAYRWHRHVTWDYRPGCPPPHGWTRQPPPHGHRRHVPAHPRPSPPPRRF